MALVSEIAEWLGADAEGDGGREILAASPLNEASARNVSFVASKKAMRDASSSRAGCLIVPLDFANLNAQTVIRVTDPRRSFAKVIRRLHPETSAVPGIHSTAIVSERATVGERVTVGPYSVIGAQSSIGDDAVIGAHCSIGDRVTLGPRALLHSNVTIYRDVEIGERVLIHSGAVIGADGFGFVLEGDHFEKFPQIGRVVIGDDVEIGANTTIDRAALGATTIGDGVKLDNIVHIGHNCTIGRHVVIAAQTGIAGGSVVEDYAVIGGQVGIADNVVIKAKAVVGAKTGVPSSKILKGDGEVYWGIPARPIKEYLEGLANVSKIAEMRKVLAELRRRLEEIEKAG